MNLKFTKFNGLKNSEPFGDKRFLVPFCRDKKEQAPPASEACQKKAESQTISPAKARRHANFQRIDRWKSSGTY